MEATDEKLNPAELEVLKYGGTQYTVSYDLRNLKAYFYTSMNPNLRSVDFKKVDFKGLAAPLKIPMRDKSVPFSKDITPSR